VYYPQPPRTSTSATETSHRQSLDEPGAAFTATRAADATATRATEKGDRTSMDGYRSSLEKNSEIEHRRQPPHTLVLDQGTTNYQGDGSGGNSGGGVVVASSPSDMMGPHPSFYATTTTEEDTGCAVGGLKENNERLAPRPSPGSDAGSSHHGGGTSSIGEETEAALNYLDRLRLDESS